VITQLSISHFKAIASATIPLGPITVLVGPNDAGKSTILQALMALSRCGDPACLSAEQLLGCLPSVVTTQGDTSIDIELSAEGMAALVSKDAQHPYRYLTVLGSKTNVFVKEEISWDGRRVLATGFERPVIMDATNQRVEDWPGLHSGLSVVANGPIADRRFHATSAAHLAPPPDSWDALVKFGRVSNQREALDNPQTRLIFDTIANDLGATLLRLDARAIAHPSPLGAPVLPDGSGLVGIVDELLTSGVGDEQIGRVNEILRRLSPHVKSVAARRHPSGGKELHFALRSGAVIPASQMSDGIVLAAALVLISLGAGTRRLLIEEPENGLHPRQLKVVADTIRSIARTQETQIILTTHSPLLLNHFGAEEVVLVTRDESGVRVKRMSEAHGMDELAAEMALGELWYNVGDNNLARPA